MAHSLGLKNTTLPSNLFSSSHRTVFPAAPYLSNVKNCCISPPTFPTFGRKFDDKRNCGVLRIRCLSGFAGAQAEESIKAQVSQNPVVIYSKTWCPYCQEAKGLFQELGVKPFVVELDELGSKECHVQDALRMLTGQSTVPNIFVGGKHIGGCSDTMELHQNGELTSLLSAAGVKIS